MLRFLLISQLIINSGIAFSQTGTADLLAKWEKAKAKKGYQSDLANVILLNLLSEQYLYNHADSSLYFAKQALRLAGLQKYTLGEAASLNNLGKTYYVTGDYTSSLDAAAKLMDISNKINYQSGIAASYQISGLIYLAQDNFNQAVTDFNKALKIFIGLKDEVQADKVYFNIGLCYDELGQSANAFYYLNKVMTIAKKTSDANLLSMALNRTGETYFHLKKYKRALGYYRQVINSKQASNWEKDFAYSGLAQTYYGLGEYGQAVLNAQKSYDLSKKVNSGWDEVRALNILSESYAALNDFKHAYFFHVQLKKSNDSLYNGEKEKEINYLHLKQQQADNIRLENDNRAKEQIIVIGKRLLIFRNLIGICTVIFIITVIRNARRTNALNKVLQQQNSDIALQKEEISKQKDTLNDLNRTKDQLFSVIGHDLRSPFTAILQTMDLIRSGDIPIEEQEVILEDFYQQVNGVALMVNNLLLWANSQQSGIKSNLITLAITDAVNETVSVSSYLAKNKNIKLYHHYDEKKWVYADLDHVKIIIQNLIGNAIKFTPEGGTIEIYYSEDETYQAIHVKDTGVGIPPEKMDKLFKITGKEISDYGTNNEPGTGIGLVLIKQFIDAHNGRLDVKSTPGTGTEFTVYFRKS